MQCRCQRNGRQPEFPKDCTKGYVSVAQEQGSFGLRNSASASIWSISGEKRTSDESANDREQKTSPRRTSRGIQAASEVLGNEYEGNNHQSYDGSAHQGEQQQDFVLVLLNSPERPAGAPARACERVPRAQEPKPHLPISALLCGVTVPSTRNGIEMADIHISITFFLYTIRACITAQVVASASNSAITP